MKKMCCPFMVILSLFLSETKANSDSFFQQLNQKQAANLSLTVFEFMYSKHAMQYKTAALLRFCGKEEELVDTVLPESKLEDREILEEIINQTSGLNDAPMDFKFLILDRVQRMIIGYQIGFQEACKLAFERKDAICKIALENADKIVRRDQK